MAKKTTSSKTNKKASPSKSTAQKTSKKTSSNSAKPAAKAPAAKKASVDKAPKPNGMTRSEHKVLKALASGAEMDREQLSAATGINGGWAKLLGAATVEGYGVQQGDQSMAAKGWIAIEQYEGSRRLVMTITASGRKALAKA